MRPTGGAPASASAAAFDGGTSGSGLPSPCGSIVDSDVRPPGVTHQRQRQPLDAQRAEARRPRHQRSRRPRHLEPVDAHEFRRIARNASGVATVSCSTRSPENSATCVAVQSTSSPVRACAIACEAPLEPRPVERAQHHHQREARSSPPGPRRSTLPAAPTAAPRRHDYLQRPKLGSVRGGCRTGRSCTGRSRARPARSGSRT